MRQPKKYVKCWLKFRPEFAQNADGTAVFKNEFRTPEDEKKAMRRFFNYITKHTEKLWQARIYDGTGAQKYIWRSENQDYENQTGS